jgi:hypothetical protein
MESVLMKLVRCRITKNQDNFSVDHKITRKTRAWKPCLVDRFFKNKLTIEPVRFASILSSFKINQFAALFKIFNINMYALLGNKFVYYRTCSRGHRYWFCIVEERGGWGEN